jgi:hypothetical protein
MTTRDDVEAALRGVIDPELNADIVDLGMVDGITIDDLLHGRRASAGKERERHDQRGRRQTNTY